MTRATVEFIPLSGVEEVGMNFYAYGYQGKWLVVDYGMGFPSDVQLDGIELAFPNPEFLANQKQNIVGLVLTHAHEDHLGALPYLWDELSCPVYGTAFTIGLLKEKLKETALHGKVPCHIINPLQTLSLSPFAIEFINMTHSILEMQGLVITTPIGSLFHTGDWKWDKTPALGEPMNIMALQNLQNRQILAVISDSTNIFETGYSTSESAVAMEFEKTLQQIEMGQHKLHPDDEIGMILVTCFASNLARVLSVAKAAAKQGRKVAVVGRAFQRYLAVGKKLGYLDDLPVLLNEKDIASIPRKKLLVIATGSQGESQGAFARMAKSEHKNLKPIRGDYAIFSSRVIPGNDFAVNFIKNTLCRNGVRLLDIVTGLHTSGHPRRGDLTELYNWIKPKSVIPIHGEQRHLAEHLVFARECGVPYGVQCQNGNVVAISSQHPPKIIGQVPTGLLVKDGAVIIPADNPEMLERKRIGNEGCLLVSVSLKNHRQILALELKPIGFALSLKHQRQLEDKAYLLLRQLLHKQGDIEYEFQKSLKNYCRRMIAKTPLVTLQILFI